MRVLRLFCICIAFIFQSGNLAQSKWVWISPYPHGNGAGCTSIADEYIYFWGGNKTIAKTSDGGESFVICTPYDDQEDVVRESRQRIAFTDSLTGIVLDRSNIYRTTDGGNSWTEQSLPGSFITFADSQIGWMGPNLRKTTDAGLTWQIKYNPVLDGKGNYSKIFALDTSRVWVIKSDDYNGEGGGIYFSSDGGENWQVQDMGIISDSTNKLYYLDIAITETGYGIATVHNFNILTTSYTTIVLKTTNFGGFWEYETFPDYRLSACFFKSDSEWLIFGNSNETQSKAVRFYTTDFGEAWEVTEEFHFGRWNSRFSVGAYLRNTNTLIVVAIYDFFRSNDFGQTFHKLTNTTDLVIRDFSIDNHFTSASQLVAGISIDYKIIISEDGGHTWTRDTIPTMEPREVVVSNGIIYLITGGRYIHISNDYGKTWEAIFHSDSYIKNLKILNQYHMAVIQPYSTPPKILYSDDGFKNWTEGPYPNSYYFNSIQLVDENVIYGCGRFSDSTGTKGFIYNSTNKGLDWRVVDVEEELFNLQMVNDRIGYVHGLHRIYKTTNSGNNWYKIYEEPPFYYYFNTIFFYDSVNGIIRDNYRFLETHDGGNTWYRNYMNLPVYGSDKILVNKGGELFALSSGRFLRYTSVGDYIYYPQIDLRNTEGIESFTLIQNYPNPFNPSTKIKFTIPQDVKRETQDVSLKVYDVLGNEIATLVNEEKPAGTYEVQFDSHSGKVRNLPSGIYFYQLKVGIFVETKKMVLIK